MIQQCHSYVHIPKKNENIMSTWRYADVHNRIVHNSHKMETIKIWMGKQNQYIHTMGYSSAKKEKRKKEKDELPIHAATWIYLKSLC